MISITPAAAKQMLVAAKQNGNEILPLRIAVKKKADGSFHYAMGFDDNELEGDNRYPSEGVEIVVSLASSELLKGTVVDYVELESGKFQFIFINPNDPAQANN